MMFRRMFVADLKIILRNRQALFWALAFPIMFATIFGLFNFDQLPTAQVAVIASDVQGEAVAAGIRRIPSSEFHPEIRTEPRARAEIEDGDLDYALIVDGSGRVRVLMNRSAADRNRIFVPIFERVLDGLNIRLAGVRPRFVLVEDAIAGGSVKYYDFVLPGLVGMGVMTYGIIGLGVTVSTYRVQRILRRILATPMKPRTFLAAIVAAHLVLAVVQSALVLAWGVLVFGGTVKGSVIWILLLAMIGNLSFLSIGFMVASRAESAEGASGLGNAVAMPMMFFAGVFFPTETLPWILPTITRFLPLRPLVDAIRKVTVDGASITALGSELLQLGAWAIVLFALASRVFRFERAA